MKKVLFLLVFVLLSACESKEPPAVSFYYWKTVCRLTPKEQQVLQSNKVQKLYVRYFDVKLVDGKPFPVAAVRFDSVKPKAAVIPVVFIKNEVFLSKNVDLPELVRNITTLVGQINSRNNLKTNEIQIDCDWSLESRDTFMAFLRQLKKSYGQTVSVTIRLHQVKYFKETKIPPVDYGVLMFYNMGKLQPGNTKAIYDKEVAEKYLPSLQSYPLRLKVALPIFSWIIHSRNKQIINLISKIDVREFQNNANFEWKENQAVVRKNTLAKGFFFKEGDRLTLEAIQEKDLESMVAQLKKYMPEAPDEILYFDLDQKNIKTNANDVFFKNCNADF